MTPGTWYTASDQANALFFILTCTNYKKLAFTTSIAAGLDLLCSLP